MTMRMLIDARHREETRVAVVKGNRVEEFDFESAERKQLKGNIYLAKVTRVEPSLQAAFVDYGGNRHGFLAFSEIHPDYYQIPKEDREALLREEAEHAAEEEALRGDQDDDDPHGDDEHGDDDGVGGGGDDLIEQIERFDDDGALDPNDTADDADHEPDEDAPPPPARAGGNGEDNAVENLRQKRMNLRRRYKIQDVIRRRQVLLVQVVKEERGNKGAALTTYLSLAGRYCVLMPNTSHGGGISRKISSPADRKRLKSIMSDLQLPQSMGCIVRTAGLQRTKTEIKRDFDYLARLWDEIRENTLRSSAPALVHADSDLIKRAIRDIYNREIDEVIVEGEEGFRLARTFMKLLMPSHAKKVQPYVDAVPLFQRFGVEDQLAAMYNPLVQLKSGGYLVINPTEALVSIDINSGRSTREHNIEQTALNTNLEAAGEIARQLRLRDMAGLVVIDFIDMESSGNVRKVEKAMKGALANDRARIQVGRISSFGLFEMSRQRLRTGVLEASTRICPHCEGTGLVRTASSAGLSALRMIEDEAARGRGSHICLRASQEAAFYVLNRKRGELAEIEDRYGVLIEVVPDGAMEGARMSVSSEGPPPLHAPRLPAPIVFDFDDDEDLPEEEEELEEEEAPVQAEPRDRGERAERADRPERAEGEEDRGDGRGRRRRRRRRRGTRDGAEGERDGAPATDEEIAEDAAADLAEQDEADADGREESAPAEQRESAETADTEDGRTARRGRRGRRGGRRRQGEGGEPREAGADVTTDEAIAETEAMPGDAEDAIALDPGFGEPVAELDAPSAPAMDESLAAVEPKPRGRRRPRARLNEDVTPDGAEQALADTVPAPEDGTAEPAETAEAAPVDEPAPVKPRRARRKAEPAAETIAETVADPVVEPAPSSEPESTDETPKPRRRTRGKRAAESSAEPAADAEVVPAANADLAVPEEAAPAAIEEAATPAGQAVDPTGDDGEPATAEGDEDASGTPRRGWWQRTFGN